MLSSSRAALFSRLAVLAENGLVWPEALRRCAARKRGRLARALFDAASHFDAGEPPREAYRRADLFTNFERELLVAGHLSGSLPQACQALSDYHTEQMKTTYMALSLLAYPTLLIHVALLVSSVIGAQSIADFGARLLIRLIIAYLAVGVPILVYKLLRRAAGTRMMVDSVLLTLPLIGRYLRIQETSHALLTLAYLYGAGINILDAVKQLEQLAQNKVLANNWALIEQRLVQGETISEAIARVDHLPNLAVDFIATGEASGKLEELLFQASKTLATEASRLLKVLIVLFTGLIFVCAIGLAAYTIFSFWLGYFEKINQVLGR